jgi:cytochrome c-type biogenesis protein CcmH
MTALIILALLLTVASAWWLVWPLRRSAGAVAGSEERSQLLTLRDRLLANLKELDVESADRGMEEGTVADERRRLEAELAGVLHQLEAPGATPATQAPAGGDTRRLWLWALVGFGIGLPLVSGGLYYANHRSTLEQLGTAGRPAAQAVPPMALEMVARLEKRLAEQPDDAPGWARLGRAYVVMGRVDDARQAYGRAVKLAPADIEVLSAYGAFLVSLTPQDPPAEAVAIYERILKVDARHPGALWVLGIQAYNQSRYGEAVKLWERLLAATPADSEIVPQVKRAVEAARDRQRDTR